MTQKLHLLGPETQYFLKHQCMFLKERNWSTRGKGIYGFPPMKWFSLNTLEFWSYRDSCYYVKGGDVWGCLWKTTPPTLIFWALRLFECHLSSVTPGFLYGAFHLLPWVFMLHGSFQLTYFVRIIRQIRRSKITVSVVPHSFRSTGSQIAPLIALLGA